MQVSKILNNYVEYFRKKMFGSPSSQVDTVDLWRNEFFFRIMLYIFPIGILIYIAGVSASIISGLWSLAIFDSVGMVIIIFIAFDSSFSINVKKILFLLTIYLLGIILFYYLGFFGPALVYLMAVSVLCALIIDEKVAVIAFISNIFVFVYFLITNSYIENPAVFKFETLPNLAVGSNFIGFNLILIAAIVSLIKYLRKALAIQGDIKAKLLEESAKLQLAKQRAEASDSFKTGFIQDVSHGIQMPLRVIRSFSELINNEQIDIEKRKYFTEIISNNAKLLQNIVNDLQILTSIENKQISVIKNEVSLNDLINEMITIFSEEYKEKNIGIIFKQKVLDGREKIKTDEAVLKKIIINLLSNALKYTELGFVEIGYIFRNDKIEVFVKDTGIGIAPEDSKNIFNRFFRVENAINSLHPGTGLGLSLAKANAEALGGDLTCTSLLHVGSTFSLNIPLK